ncbi:MAG TPA: hypothetical protein VGF24_20690 [Vicinamibacterales bacterium]
MADVSERLDRLEQALGTANQQLGEVQERLDNHDGRFNQIDERFNRIDERFNKVDERFDSLESDLQELRMLEESNFDRIKKIAEVQSRHGEKLDELAEAIEPLKVLPDLYKQVVQNHERRITALEKRHPDSDS